MTIAWIAPALRPRRESADRRARRQAHRRRFALEQFEDRTLLSIWIGGDSGDWSLAANWSDGKLPSATEPAIIGDGATVTVDIATASARSLTLKDGATLDLSGNTLRTNATGNAVASGLTMSEDATLIGGNDGNGGNGGSLVVGGNFTIDAGGVFDVKDVTFTGVTTGTVDSNVAFKNVTITYGTHHFKVAPGATLDVDGDLTINSNNSITGTILASGDVTSNAPWGGNTSRYGHLILDGSGPQTLSGANGGKLPNVVNAKTNNSTLTLTGGISPENWTQTSGKLNAAGSTTSFRGGYTSVDTGNTSLGNVTVDMGNNHFNVVPGTGKLAIGGDLLISSAQTIKAALGAITVAGNLTSTDTTVAGTADITMTGGASATITAAPGDFPNGGIVIKKGSASLNANVTTPLDGPLTIESVWAINKAPGTDGLLTAGGNVVTKTGVGGNASIVFAGGANQTLTTTKDGAGVVGVLINKSGGSLTLNTGASSNTLRVNGSWIVDAGNQGAINLNGGAIRFTSSSRSGDVVVDAGSSGLTFNDVEVAIGGNDLNGVAMVVDGDLTLTSVYFIKGVITAHGDVETAATAISSDGGRIEFAGAGDQHLSASSANGGVPAVVINKPGGALFIEGPNTINANGNWTWTKGVVDASGSTVRLTNASNVNTGPGSGGMKFDNFEIAVKDKTLKVENKLGVLGDLTINSAWAINAAAGAITVEGNLTSTASRVGGAANIWMVGNRDASIKGGDFPNGGIVIDKGPNTTLHANVTHPLDGPLRINTLQNFSGSLAVAGNVTSSANNVYTQNGGKIVFKGDKPQILSTTKEGARVPGVEIDKDGGKLTLSPANLITVTGDWVYKQGDVDTTDSRVLFVTGGKTVDTGPLGSGMRFNDVEVAISGNLNAVNMVVAGGLHLRVAATIEGQITALGNVVASASAAMRPKNGGEILFTGDGQQTLTGKNAGLLPGVRIDKSGGTLSLIGGIGVTGPWQYTKGTVDAGESTVTFSYQATKVDTGSRSKMAFNNAVIALGNSSLTATNLAVDGNLIINSVKDINADSGKITVKGDLISNDNTVGGNADITMIGPKDARIEGGDFPNGGIIIKQKGNATVDANVLKPLAGPLVLTKATPAKALTGTFQVANNVTSEAVSIDGNDDGSPVLVFMGDKKQTLSTGYGQMVPGVKFDKTGGSVDIVSDKGELKVSGGWIVAKDNAASINIPDEVAIRFDNAKKGNPGHREINTGDSAGFKNVILTPGGDSTVTITKMVVNGDLNTINVGELNGEPIDLYGNLITQTVNSGMTGSGAIRFVGDRDQTIMATGNARRLPNVIIEKTGSGVLSVDLDSGWINVMGNWDYNGGKVDMAGSTIRFAGTGFNGGNNYIRANGMIFNTIHFVAGDMDVLDAGNDAGELFYTGSVYKPNRVVKGTLVKI